MLIWMGQLGDEEETALMEMSDLKSPQTIWTRHSYLDIFLNKSVNKLMFKLTTQCNSDVILDNV